MMCFIVSGLKAQDERRQDELWPVSSGLEKVRGEIFIFRLKIFLEAGHAFLRHCPSLMLIMNHDCCDQRALIE